MNSLLRTLSLVARHALQSRRRCATTEFDAGFRRLTNLYLSSVSEVSWFRNCCPKPTLAMIYKLRGSLDHFSRPLSTTNTSYKVTADTWNAACRARRREYDGLQHRHSAFGVRDLRGRYDGFVLRQPCSLDGIPTARSAITTRRAWPCHTLRVTGITS